MKHVFIIGSKGIPAAYGGFETFVENLTGQAVSEDIQYHVACMSDHNEEFTYHNAKCFRVKVPDIGPARAVYYDLAAFHYCIQKIKKEKIEDAVVYVLACRIGPFVGHFKRQLHRLSGTLYVNPDGHEFMRAKWNKWIRKYWKYSEKGMVKHADLLVCDSKNIEQYIRDEYHKYQPKTTFIAYGTLSYKAGEPTEELLAWYQKFDIRKENYYLIVGRFVPENNYETMIREFMASDSTKDLVIITNVEENAFYESLKEKTGFLNDKRIKFAGTVYDAALLAEIRYFAYGYFHGHEVGGTNPSLLEALSTTKLNLLLDVGFNKEVGEDAALYWNKKNGNLATLIQKADTMDEAEREELGRKAKDRMKKWYSWEAIVQQYETLFLTGEEERE